MNRGIYTVLSGGIAQERRLEIITNNIANINTSGYKREEPIFKTYLPKMIGINGDISSISPISNRDKAFVEVIRTITQFSPGNIRHTGSPLDMAIEGDGFFVVETRDGNRYTRDGSFTIDSERRLTTQDGFLVLGEGGPIIIEKGKLTIDSSGRILIDGNEIDNLMIVDFSKPYRLQKAGNTLFKGEGGTPSENFKVLQGMIEFSNVEPILELSSMIEVMRSYEAYQKVIQSIDETTARSINEVGKI